jgi:quercetin dioxygenase-like cupin family protein
MPRSPIQEELVSESLVARLAQEAWRDDAPGIRARECFDVDGKRFAIVEYGPGAARDDWCDAGHYGYVISGRIRYRFADGGPALEAGAGEGFFLSTDPAHQGANAADEGPTMLFLVDPI